MTVETLWHDPETQRRITRSDRPSEATRSLLGNTVWGSRSTKYRILGIEAKLARLREPSFFVLSENGRELCVFVLDKCHKRVAGTPCGAYHFVMASTMPDRQNQGLAGQLIEHIRDYCVATVGQPGLGYAYVEQTTEFSLHLSDQIGHSVDADIPLTLFTRLFPRAHPHVGVMRPEETETILTRLEQTYACHELTDFDAALKPQECFVYRDGHTIIAAAQAELLRWSVQSMPGPLGKALLTVLPRVPGLNRMLDLHDLRILRLGHLCVQAGSEPALFALLETCLHHHGAKIGLIMLDARSPVLQRIRRTGRMGLLSRALNGSAKLRIDVVGMDGAQFARLRQNPVMVSAADVF